MSEGQTPVLEIAGLSIALPGGGDRAFAVDDVSLSVGAGEIVCVVGESGSGKSVTAFSVMGLLARALRPSRARSAWRARMFWLRRRSGCGRCAATGWR